MHGFAGLLVAVLLVSASCSTHAAPRHARTALPLPTPIVDRYALPGPVEETTLAPIGGTDGRRFLRGGLRCGAEVIDFRLILPAETDAPAPFVLCLPILAGGRELMWIVADDLSSRGYAVAWAARVTSALKPPQREVELEQLLRRTLLHNRALLAWARAQPDVDASRTAVVGISLGGMIASALMAIEPDLRAGALCLSGADLPNLLMHSAESRAIDWRHWRRRADGLAGSELQRLLEGQLLTDPGLLGPYVATDRVLLVQATLDEVVPERNRELLWESLGRPRRMLVPLGHYTAAVAIGPILGAVDEFFRDRFAGAFTATGR